jgi:hypothetical protein
MARLKKVNFRKYDLVTEACQGDLLLTFQGRTMKHLQRDFTLQFGILRALHLAHPGLGNRCKDFVRAETVGMGVPAGMLRSSITRDLYIENSGPGQDFQIPQQRRYRSLAVIHPARPQAPITCPSPRSAAARRKGSVPEFLTANELRLNRAQRCSRNSSGRDVGIDRLRRSVSMRAAPHSQRSAIIGSTRMARRAGIHFSLSLR